MTVDVELTNRDYEVLYAHHDACERSFDALEADEGMHTFRPVIAVAEHGRVMPYVGFEMTPAGVEEALDLIKMDVATPEQVILTGYAEIYEIDADGVSGPTVCICSHFVNESGIGYVWCTTRDERTGDWVPINPGNLQDTDTYFDLLANYICAEAFEFPEED